MTDPPPSGTPAPPAGPGPGGESRQPLLSLALASMMDEVHAHSGAVYLLADGRSRCWRWR